MKCSKWGSNLEVLLSLQVKFEERYIIAEIFNESR